jgi:hypothetical protein
VRHRVLESSEKHKYSWKNRVFHVKTVQVLTIVLKMVVLGGMLKQNASLGPIFPVHIDEVPLRKVQ